MLHGPCGCTDKNSYYLQLFEELIEANEDADESEDTHQRAADIAVKVSAPVVQ